VDGELDDQGRLRGKGQGEGEEYEKTTQHVMDSGG